MTSPALKTIKTTEQHNTLGGGGRSKWQHHIQMMMIVDIIYMKSLAEFFMLKIIIVTHDLCRSVYDY